MQAELQGAAVAGTDKPLFFLCTGCAGGNRYRGEPVISGWVVFVLDCLLSGVGSLHGRRDMDGIVLWLYNNDNEM